MKILVIEDNQAIAAAYEKILLAAGHDAETISNPLVAASKVLRTKYDLLLVDLMLPEIDGIELIRRIRDESISTPIVITTNMGGGYDQEAIDSLNVAEVVVKSTLGPEELRNLVLKYDR